MSKILKNTFIYSLSNLFHQAINFVLLPIYSKYLSPEQFGIVASMHVIQAFITILYSFSLEKSIIRMYWDYENEHDRNTYLGSVTISILFIATIMVGLSFSFKNQLNSIFSEIDFYPFYVLIILNTFVITISNIPLYYLRLKHKAKQYFIYSVIRMLLNSAFVLFLIIYYRFGAKGVLTGQLLSNTVILIPLLFVIVKNIPFRFNFQMLKESLRFSLPIIPSLIAGWVIGQMDRTIIAKFFTLSDVGIFSIAKKITLIIGFVNASFVMAYHPVFFELANSGKNNIKTLVKYNNAYILFLMFFTFLIIFFTKDVFNLVIDVRYHEAIKYVPILALSVFIGAVMKSVLGAFFQQSKKMKADMYIGIIGAIVYITAFYVFIINYGMYGAVFSGLISSTLIFITAYFYTKKNCFFLPFDWKNILIFISIFTVFLFVSIYTELDNKYYNFAKNIILIIIMFFVAYLLYGKKYIKPFFQIIKNKNKHTRT